MAYGSFQSDSAGMKPRTEMVKPPNPFEQRLLQPEPAPAQHPGLNPASFRSNPFARMGGMGARAAMGGGQPQPPPQAPAYGLRERLSGGMRGLPPMMDRGGGGYNPNAPSPDMQRRMRMPEDYRRGADEAFSRASLAPPPTGMPGGIMGERSGMDRLRAAGGQMQGMPTDPIRQRLMAQRGGGMPPPQPAPPAWAGGDPRFPPQGRPGSANPFFDRLYAQDQPSLQRPAPMQQNWNLPPEMYQ